MGKIWILLLTLTISSLFLYVPSVGEIGFILNPKIKLNYNQYIWMAGEHLIMVTLALIIYDDATDYRKLLAVFVWIQIVDFLGFVLAYDDPLRGYIISFNWIKLFIFSLAIGIELWRGNLK